MPSCTRRQLFVLGIFIILPVFANAQVVINEIYYAPQSKSWIEIYNGSASAIDLTQYKVLDSGAAVNGHGITVMSGTNPLPSQSYAVIAKDPTTFSGVSFSLFKASLGANTSGDTFTLKSGANIIDSVLFSNTQGANGDGNSLQKQSDGTWIVASPTPGTANSSVPIGSTAGSGSSADTSASSTETTTTTTSSSNTGITYTATETVSTHYSYLPLSDFQAQQNLAVSAGRNRMSAVGNPLQFQAEANIPDDTVKYNWTFGDGTSQSGKLVKHVYQYPGTYVVVLNASMPDSNAVSRTTVTVVEPKLSVIEANNSYIKIANTASKEINLYGWEIISEGRSFTFPTDTIILANASVYFPASVTSLSPLGATDVQILPVSESPLTVSSPSVVATKDTAFLQAKRAEMYQELLGLQQEANILASQNSSEPLASVSPIQETTTSTDSTEVAAPVEAIGWLTSLKHFFLGTQ